MRLQYYSDEEGESVIGLWVPKRECFIDVTDQEEQLWTSMLPGAASKKMRKEIETWISQGAPKGVPVDMDGLVVSSALHVLPGTIACLGKSYAAHAMEFSGDAPTEPSIFLKAVSAISSDLEEVLRPVGSTKLDYEVELAVILGDTLKNATEEEAARAIVGYTLMCDYSERAFQLERGGQWTKGKSYESFAPFGPVLVTKDEIHDPDNLVLTLKVNGEIRQQDTTASLIWPVAKLVAYVSQFMTLNPGDVISTGTPSGVGHGMTPPQYLQPGDVVEFGCDKIGWVRQHVVQDTAD